MVEMVARRLPLAKYTALPNLQRLNFSAFEHDNETIKFDVKIGKNKDMEGGNSTNGA